MAMGSLCVSLLTHQKLLDLSFSSLLYLSEVCKLDYWADSNRSMGLHLILTFIKFFRCGMIWTSLDSFLYVFRLHENGHGSDDGTSGWLPGSLESHRACCGHANIQFLKHI